MLETVAAAVRNATVADWLLLVGGVLLALYLLGTWNYDYFARRGIPSTKPRLPFLGDFYRIFAAMTSFPVGIREMYNKGKGHGVFGVFEFTSPMFMIRDPEILKVVGVKDFDSFINHRSFATEKTDPIFSKNLFNLKDQAWRDMRATLSPAFTTSKIKAMLPFFSKCADQMTKHLRQRYSNSKEGALKKPLEVDMKDIYTRMTSDVIATTAFGVSCDSLSNPDNEFFKKGKTLTTFTKIRSILFFAFIALPKVMEKTGFRLLDGKSTDFFDSLIHETIRERQKKSIFRPDVLQLLMQAREGQLKAEKEDADEAEDVGVKAEDVGVKAKKLSDEDISAQAMIFFFAGFETVSSALCLTTHILAHHPDVTKRLQEEIDSVFEETGGNPTYEAVQNMKYLDSVLSESMRLHPLAPSTDRVCQNDTTLPAGATSEAVLITKGTLMQLPIVGLHYDPQYWDEPEKFDPERFNEVNKPKIKPFTYMPFGLGPRICVAQRFALIEVKWGLIYLLRSFDLHPTDKTKYPVDYKPGANLMAKGGFWCGLTPREG